MIATSPRRARPRVVIGTFTLPASYATGGFTLDLTTRIAKLDTVALEYVSVAVAFALEFEHTLNSPADGKDTIKCFQRKYKLLSAMGSATNPPSGVTVQTTSGQTVNNESAHVHSFNHDHAQVTSSGPAQGGGGVPTVPAGANMTTHSHPVNPPNLVVNSGAGDAHNHVSNILYSHKHTITLAGALGTRAELAAATDVSGTTMRFVAVGV